MLYQLSQPSTQIWLFYLFFFKADFAKYLPCPFGIRSLPADLYGVHIIWVTPFLARA